MIRVEIMEAYGTGAGYGNEPHKYWSFRGVGLTLRSVKEAVKQARTNIRKDPEYSEGASWIPVLSEIKIFVENKMVHRASLD